MKADRKIEYMKMLSEFQKTPLEASQKTATPQQKAVKETRSYIDDYRQNLCGFPILSDAELEKKLTETQNYSRFMIFFEIFFIIIGIIVIIWFHVTLSEDMSFFVILPFIFIISLFHARREKIRKGMKQLFSDNIVRGALKEVMDVYIFAHGLHIPADKIKSAELIHNWNTDNGSDYVKAKYRGAEICFSDVHLEDVRRRSKRTTRTTRFKGQWLICEIDKVIEARLRLREREGILFGKNLPAKSDVETENIAFNEKFQILTSNPHTAFMILTPQFMERIIEVDKRANAKTSFCFIRGYDNRNYIHLAFHNNRDLFEYDAKVKINAAGITAFRNKIKHEIQYITGMIDLLMQCDFLIKEEDI